MYPVCGGAAIPGNPELLIAAPQTLPTLHPSRSQICLILFLDVRWKAHWRVVHICLAFAQERAVDDAAGLLHAHH